MTAIFKSFLLVALVAMASFQSAKSQPCCGSTTCCTTVPHPTWADPAATAAATAVAAAAHYNPIAAALYGLQMGYYGLAPCSCGCPPLCCGCGCGCGCGCCPLLNAFPCLGCGCGCGCKSCPFNPAGACCH